jgi:hypothetical protein
MIPDNESLSTIAKINNLLSINRKHKKSPSFLRGFVWALLGSNQRPPDYESGATNQLS